ncbi:MAG: hypothetical protein KatS3mg115_1754 [Candidatus Poribacteria bacterium]|nr:MAG: hypothetical protein KatS3mg115_1754 [Candidatus Poribacteria bacterium]
MKKIAAICTVYYKYSHAQHIVDRFLESYGYAGKYYRPERCRVVSLYVDQFPENDLSRERSERFGVPIYPTIAEALTLGGERLAVDGVLLIGEHGNYPTNEKGQRLYPRYRFFKETEAVFRESGRSVPVFNDKHLSYDWSQAVEMVEVSRELGFPFMAGSSLPVTWRIPALEFPLGVRLREAVCVCYGGVDSYDFHGLETIQCMVERREGGEVGVRSLQAVRGEAFWEALREGRWDQELMWAAIARSFTRRPAREGRLDFDPRTDRLEEVVPDPIAYVMEYSDGLRATMMLLNRFVEDFNFAARLEDGSIASCQMYLPMPPRRTTLASFFTPLCQAIERMFLTGKPTYPVERTLLTTGQTYFGVESLHRGGERLETPELAVSYRPPEESFFWRQ